MLDKPAQEICFRFFGVVCQSTGSEELDLASLAHSKTRRLSFALEDDKIGVWHGDSVSHG
jgi:hypothetical protein